jgi:NitT/TauT family transport system permease protein
MSTSLAAAPPAIENDDRTRARHVAAHRRRKRLLQTVGLRLLSLIVVLTVWQIVGGQVDQTMFTTPGAVALAAMDMIRSGELIGYLWPSLVVLFYGLMLASTLGILVGLVLARSWVMDVLFGGYIIFLYATPTVALVPMIVLWAGFDTAAKTIILFLFAFFPVVINTYQGVKNVDPKLMEVARSFRCSEWQMWRNIVLPGALPFIITGLRLAVGRGLIGMVLADLYTAISGIGYLIVRSAGTYQIDRMFVPVITVGLLGVLLSSALHALERWVAPWTVATQD